MIKINNDYVGTTNLLTMEDISRKARQIVRELEQSRLHPTKFQTDIHDKVNVAYSEAIQSLNNMHKQRFLNDSIYGTAQRFGISEKRVYESLGIVKLRTV